MTEEVTFVGVECFLYAGEDYDLWKLDGHTSDLELTEKIKTHEDARKIIANKQHPIYGNTPKHEPLFVGYGICDNDDVKFFMLFGDESLRQHFSASLFIDSENALVCVPLHKSSKYHPSAPRGVFDVRNFKGNEKPGSLLRLLDCAFAFFDNTFVANFDASKSLVKLSSYKQQYLTLGFASQADFLDFAARFNKAAYDGGSIEEFHPVLGVLRGILQCYGSTTWMAFYGALSCDAIHAICRYYNSWSERACYQWLCKRVKTASALHLPFESIPGHNFAWYGQAAEHEAICEIIDNALSLRRAGVNETGKMDKAISSVWLWANASPYTIVALYNKRQSNKEKMTYEQMRHLAEIVEYLSGNGPTGRFFAFAVGLRQIAAESNKQEQL